MELEIHNISGKKTSKKVTLSDTIFGIAPNDHAIYLDCKLHLANRRQGTHKAKERAEIARTTKKAFRQKGTGNARRGSMRSPLVRGGGTTFGPRPRDYSFKLNKKLRKLARKSALSYKAKESGIVVLEDFNFETPKTKQYVDLLANLKLNDKKTLMVVAPSDNNNVHLSSRNLQNTKVVQAKDISTYDVLNAKSIILCEGAVKEVENLLSN